jgi:hypothetical protein
MTLSHSRTEVIAYRADDLPRLADNELKEALTARPHYALTSLMGDKDSRKRTFCPSLQVPSIKVTEALKERVRNAFVKAGCPVLFTWI